ARSPLGHERRAARAHRRASTREDFRQARAGYPLRRRRPRRLPRPRAGVVPTAAALRKICWRAVARRTTKQKKSLPAPAAMHGANPPPNPPGRAACPGASMVGLAPTMPRGAPAPPPREQIFFARPQIRRIYQKIITMGGLEPPTQRPRVRAANNFGTNMPGGYVYILASKRNGTLYIGITCNLVARVIAHREGRGSSFVKKYDVTRLVLYEYYPLYMDAMRRETS